MKKRKLQLIAVLVVLALAAGLLTTTALADETPAEEVESDTEELLIAEAPAEETAEEDPAPEKVTVSADETYFNDGLIVFNNGGVVFNNEGVVFNNGGTVYNNMGIVYNNGPDALVYNNDGTVRNNGGTVIDGEEAEEAISEAEEEAAPEEEVPEGAPAEEAEAAEEAPAEEAEAEEEAPIEEAAVEEAAPAEGVHSPVFTLADGTYPEGTEIEITAEEGAKIYYTLDGTEPTAESTLYEKPFVSEEGVTVRAIAVKDGSEPGQEAKASYAFPRISCPGFDAVKVGYIRPNYAKITLDNAGSVYAVIKSVTLRGENITAFSLNTTLGGTVNPGYVSTKAWNIQPVAGLKAGTYTAELVFLFDSGAECVLPLTFEVA